MRKMFKFLTGALLASVMLFTPIAHAYDSDGGGYDPGILDAYVLLAGRSGGQTIYGSYLSGEDLTLGSTSHATKGSIILLDPVVLTGGIGNITISDASPSIFYKDTDCTDSDVNAQVVVNATDTGSGTEDIDVTYSTMVGGVLTPYITVDADGDLTIASLTDDIILTAAGDSVEFGVENINMGSATVDTGALTMIKGAQTGDPQVQMALSADANGDFSITTDTGEIRLTAVDDIILDAGGNGTYVVILSADNSDSLDLSHDNSNALLETDDGIFKFKSKESYNHDTEIAIETTTGGGTAYLSSNTGGINFRDEHLITTGHVYIGNDTANFYNGANTDGGRLAVVDNTDATISIENYSITDSNSGFLNFLKSGSSTKGTLAPTAQDESMGIIVWTGVDSGNNKEGIASIQAKQSNASAASLGGYITMGTYGTDRNFNTDQFRANADGSLTSTSSRASQPIFTVINTNADALGATIGMTKDGGSAANGDVIGNISITADDSGGNATPYGLIQWKTNEVTDGQEAGICEILLPMVGTYRSFLKMSASSGGADGGSFVVNTDLQDMNFRVKTVNHATGIFVDAGTSQISYAVNAAITASTTQSQGQEVLAAMINNVATVANANDVVTMPDCVAGIRIVISNNGANTLQIFPSSGDNLGAGVDTSVTLTAGNNVEYWSYDSTNWES